MTAKPERTCFVIGPIGETGSETRAYADDFLKYIVTESDALKKFGYTDIVRADQFGEPGRITSQIIRMVHNADLVIADLTWSNANVYYELSLRHALGKPAIHMALAGTNLSFDLQDNRTIFYTLHSRDAEEARAELAVQIEKVNAEGYEATNPILETLGLIALEVDPKAHDTAELMRELQEIREVVGSIKQAVRRPRPSDFSGSPTIGEILAGDTGASQGSVADQFAEFLRRPRAPVTFRGLTDEGDTPKDT